MTDKEFKRLSRAELIEIIYKLQLEIDKLGEEKRELSDALADKRLRLNKAGNIADAALEINDCFRCAQKAAEQYLDEIKAIREETEEERKRILCVARNEAEAIIADAKKADSAYDSENEAVLTDQSKDISDNGDGL